VFDSTSLTTPLFIEVHAPSQRSEGHVFVCSGYRFFFCFYDFATRFWKWSEGVVFCFVLFFTLFYRSHIVVVNFNGGSPIHYIMYLDTRLFVYLDKRNHYYSISTKDNEVQ